MSTAPSPPRSRRAIVIAAAALIALGVVARSRLPRGHAPVASSAAPLQSDVPIEPAPAAPDETTMAQAARVETIGDYHRAEAPLRRLAWQPSADGDDRDPLARARILVLLGRWYDELELESAIAGGREDDAASRRRAALADYTAAAQRTTEILARRSDDFEGALRDGAPLDPWLHAHAGAEADAELLLWAGAAWSGKSRTAEGPEAADARAAAEKFLTAARANGRGPTWELATAELGTLRARSTPPRLDQAKALFEEAIHKAPHGSPLVRVAYATEVACRKGDGALHGALLGEASTWTDPEPQRRWEIAAAAEAARRAGTDARWRQCRGGR